MTRRDYTHVLYHGNCYDGFGAAYAAWRALGDAARYIPVLYGNPSPAMPESARVLICDFSYPRGVLEALRGRVASLTVIDHHKTAEQDLAGLSYATFDLNRSGAALTWLHFHGEPVPDFILYLEDRDLWRFALPLSKEVSQALRAYPMDFGVWHGLSDRLPDLRTEGVAVSRFTDQMVAIMCDNAWMQDVGGHVVPVTNATVFFSEVGEQLCLRYPTAPFAAYYLDRKDGKRQWGLRSRGDFDCSAVAKALGGGGHPGAAGFVEERP